MMHDKRRWCVSTIATPEELALLLTDRTWTLCTGFLVQGHPEYLFLNDSTHEDGAAEFGIVRGGLAGPHVQIESITFGWCSLEKATTYVRGLLAGKYDQSDFAHPVTLKVETPAQHGRCHRCA